MHSYEQLLKRFEEFVKEQHFPQQPSNLYDPCRHILSIGGKRIRPVLLMMAGELFGELSESHLHAATAIEYFHNFTLVHDDIMDGSPIRRGLPTVHEKWNIPIGILSGDVLNIYAYEHLTKVSPEILGSCISLFNRTAIEVCEGQQMDMDFEQRERVKIEEYIEMIRLKTSVLLAASLKLGAMISGAAEVDAELLYQFGIHVGISFQLKDDYLDAFGSSDKTGKQVGGDIRANKKTFLLIKALEKANPDQMNKILELLLRQDQNKVTEMLELFQELNIPAEVTDQKIYYSQRAFEFLDQVNLPDERKTVLKEIAYFLLNREV